MAGPRDGAIWLDDIAAGSDDAKLDEALHIQENEEGKPPVHLPHRHQTYIQPRIYTDGTKVVYPWWGHPMNLEQGTQNVPCRITLGGDIGNNANSWWSGAGDTFNTHFGGFAVDGGSSRQVFHHASGSLYACRFGPIGANLIRSVWGSPEQPLLCTQVTWYGHSSIINSWEQCINVAGSDCSMLEAYMNIGVSSSPDQAGDGRAQVRIGLSKSDIGYLYITGLNGWTCLDASGGSDSNNETTFHGGVYEGYKPGTPNPGPAVICNKGSGAFVGSSFGHCDPNTVAVVDVLDGDWTFTGCGVHKGNMPETTPTIRAAAAAKVYASGWVRHQGENWAGLPRYSGAVYVDGSMQPVGDPPDPPDPCAELAAIRSEARDMAADLVRSLLGG